MPLPIVDPDDARERIEDGLAYLVDQDGYPRADLEAFVAERIAALYGEDEDVRV